VSKERQNLYLEDKCTHCGSTFIVNSVRVGSVGGGDVGLRIAGQDDFIKVFVQPAEPMYAQVCRTCGTVFRLYVHNPRRLREE